MTDTSTPPPRRRWTRRIPRSGQDRVHPDDQPELFGLVEQARAGDRLAFAQLYDRLHARVYRVVMARVASPEDAEDLVAETFIDIWNALDRFAWTGAPFTGWVLAIACTRAAGHHRTRSRRPNTVGGDEAIEWGSGGADDQHLVGSDLRNEARRLLGTLPKEQCAILLLRFYGGLSAEETGEAVGRTATSVRQIQMKALERLAQQLRREEAA